MMVIHLDARLLLNFPNHYPYLTTFDLYSTYIKMYMAFDMVA